MDTSKNRFNQLSFLLYFLFGGAIVGETVALTMAVTVLGPAIISNLYLINGVLLLLLPILFFQNIDKINRGKLLSSQLLITAGILSCYLVIFIALGKKGCAPSTITILILLIYPISYLSKTILFLTFWTLANDIYSTNESKKGFPIVAAWGFLGGLSGACIARLLLEKVDTVAIICLWIFAYCAGWYFSNKATKKYWRQLLNKEDSVQQTEKPNIFINLEGILDSRLIRLIAILYFCAFIALFLQDFLFWKKSSSLFATSKTLASFQFTFYLTHGLITIIGLRFVMPSMIHKWGFTRIFAILPLMLLSGSVVMLLMNMIQCDAYTFFVGFVIIQFGRYVLFENTFSPTYQMFFAAVPKEKRGRAKTFLDGIVKPCAIILSGIILLSANTSQNGIAAIIGVTSLIMVYIVSIIRKTYMEALIPRFISMDAAEDIISKIGSHKDLKIVSLIREYSHSNDADVRSLAVKILSYDGSKQAFKIVRDIFENERNQTVKEMIARSLKHFPANDLKAFVELLLNNSNPRIRANVLYSINGAAWSWQRQLLTNVRSMFFENNPRIQIEAARFLWNYGNEEDKENVFSLIDIFCGSKNANKRSAGIYLVGMLKPKKWEIILKENLQFAPLQVFKKSIEALFRFGSRESQLSILTTVENLPRQHIACTGKILQSIGIPALETAMDYLRTAQNRRMVVEVLHAIRLAIAPAAAEKVLLPIDNELCGVLTQWAFKDLEQSYYDAFLWYQYSSKRDNNEFGAYESIVEEALRDQIYRVCERILDVMAILENRGTIAALRNEFDLGDSGQRLSLAEILETLNETAITPYIVPFLRNDEWEDIAKIGKSRFQFETEVSAGALWKLVRSKNKWICFCSLYVWFKNNGGKNLKHDEIAVLNDLQKERNIVLSNAAREIAMGEHRQEENSVKPFDLLERVMSLKKTDLFRRIPAEKLMGLAEIIQCRSYKSGTLISREGEISDHLYIVRHGSLKIVKLKNNVKTLLSILGEGETYGEIGLFNQAPRSASALANDDCELWIVRRSELKRFLLEMPEIAYNFLEIFSEKLRKSSDNVAQLNSSYSNKKDYL